MAVYARWIFPRLIDWAMRNRDVCDYRKALIPLAVGRVAEIGIGSGLNLPLYTKAVEQIIGIDPSPELLRKATERLPLSRHPVHLIQASAEALPLADKSVDTLVMTWTLCSIPDPRRALAEMQRVLRPDGQLLFAEHGLAPEPQVARWQHRLDPLWTRLSCHLDRPVNALICEAGFAIADLRTGYLGKGPRPLTFIYSGRATPV